MKKVTYSLRSLALVLSLTAPVAWAVDPAPTSSPSISPEVALNLLSQLENLQLEVQRLRGMVEEQGYEIEKMKRSQRDRYIDLDKRISLLMSRPVPTASATAVTESATAATTGSSESVAPAALVAAPVVVTKAAPVVIEPASADVQAEYRSAYDLIRQKEFKNADAAFSQFVLKHPNNELTGNGYYWLGELKLVLGKPADAVTQFETVVNRFKGHTKEPDAIYKLGIVNDQLNNKDKAKAYLAEVVQRFPDTNTAKLATSYLSNMK